MRVFTLTKLLSSPRNPNYLLAWAVLTFAILLVIFLAMQLWIDCAIVAGALCVSVLLMAYPRIPPDDEEDGD